MSEFEPTAVEDDDDYGASVPVAAVDLPIGKAAYEDLSGTAGCIVGSAVTTVLRGARNGGRLMDLADLYKKFNGHATSHPWDLTLPTFLHSLGDDGVMFYNKIVAVYESGMKPLVRLELFGEVFLRTTPDHPILTTNGWVQASDLKPGMKTINRGSMRAQSNGGRDLSARLPRVIVNVKYHPYGSYKLVEQRYEYTRVARARLVVEAALNNLPYAEFVHALKHNEELAATFRYIPPDFDVHHDDEDTLNDELSNLVVMSKAEHARLHNQRGNFRFDSIQEVDVVNVTSVDAEMTYDIQMNAPANNFCANGVVVHNTGKTWTAKKLIEQSPPGCVALAATTGIAAVNLGEGTTINALLKYFDTNDLRDKFVNGRLHSILRKHRRAGLRRILIDEKSMMNGDQLTYITRAVDQVNTLSERDLEKIGAGGDDDDKRLQDEESYIPSAEELAGVHPQLGVTVVGDFGQLPPIPAKEFDPKLGRERNLPVVFAFDSPEWGRYAANRTRLEKIWRQEAQDFIRGLQAVRRGDVTSALAFFNPNRFSADTDDKFEGTTIYAKNDAVDRHNQLCLDALRTPELIAKAVRTGQQRSDWKQIPEQLRLKEGALIMLLANRRVYEDEEDATGRIIYANGDLGELLEKDLDGTWLVRLQRNRQVVKVFAIRRENTIPLEPGRRKQIKEAWLAGTGPAPEDVITEKGKGKSEIIGTIDYMPMRAAYGATVHKTQGLTLDRIQVNIRDPFFKQPGMLFVALSRARTVEGLRIVGNQTGFVERCRIEPRVQPWL
jgi:hypothetical protein